MIAPSQVEAVYPLTPTQEGMILHGLEGGELGVYAVQWLCRLSGRLDGALLARAWKQVVSRHSLLRAALAGNGSREPLWVVLRDVDPPWRVEDWRGLGEAESARRLACLLVEDRRAGFELHRAPLLRFALLRTGDEEHQLIWTFHHALLDGWSLSLVAQEAFRLYDGWARGEAAVLPTAPSWAGYLRWIKAQDLEPARRQLRANLGEVSEPSALPADRPHAPERLTAGSAQIDLPWDEVQLARLQQLGRSERLTLNTLTLGAWAWVLSRRTGADETLFGVVVSGRPSSLAGVEQTVGLFIQTLPLLVRLPWSRRRTDWLRALQIEQMELWEQATPSLPEIHRLTRLPPGAPLFESIFLFENFPVISRPAEISPGLWFESRAMRELMNYPLALVAWPGHGATLRLTYDPARFDLTTVARLLAHLSEVLASLAAEPRLEVGRLPAMTTAERHQLSHEWTRPPCWERGQQPPVVESILRRLDKAPEAVALVAGQEQLSGRELGARVRRLAAELRRRGCGGGEKRVGIALSRGPALVESVLAVMAAGATYVPLDPELPAERLSFMAADAGLTLLLTEALASGPLADLAVERLVLPLSAAASEGEETTRKIFPEQLCYLLYTSGSTGRPKGVAVSHGALANFLTGILERPGLGPLARLLAVTTLSFDIAALELYAPLLAGARLILASAGESGDGDRLLELLAIHRVTILQATPSTFRLLLEAGAPDAALETWIGGEVLPPDLARRLREHGHRVVNLYGPTETTVWSSLDDTVEAAGAITIGRALRGNQIAVVDRGGIELGIGVVGEIFIAGAGLARGYHGRPGLTAERFMPHPGSNGGRRYRSGDLGRFRADGRLECLGRIDGQVKLRGFRIELGEIEAALARQPGVRRAAVALTQEAGEPRLVACVVAEAETPLNGHLRHLLEGLRRELPAYMVPTRVVALDRLPTTANGKLDRRALVARASTADETPTEPSRALSSREAELAELWSDLLGVTPSSPDDNFLALGGHSLLLLRLRARLRERFGIAPDFPALFASPTLAAMAAKLDGGAPPTEVVRIPRASEDRRRLPLAPGQERLWFLSRIETRGTAYNLYGIFAVRGRLRDELLWRAWGRLAAAQEALRTTFHEEEGTPFQSLHPAASPALSRVDLRTLGAGARRRAQHLAEKASGTRFDLARLPLAALYHFDLAPEAAWLVPVLPHLVADGWSLGLIAEGLWAGYAQLLAGETTPVPQPPLGFGDVAVWQRQQSTPAALEAPLAFWRRQLEGAPPVLDLPLDRPRPSVRNGAGLRLSRPLTRESVEQLRRLSARKGASLFAASLAIFGGLLYRWSGANDLPVGTPIADRPDASLEEMVGFFANTLVLRLRLRPASSFAELLSETQRLVLACYQHRSAPFLNVVEVIQPPRSLSASPLFQVAFSLEEAARRGGQVPGLAIESLDLHNGTAKWDLFLEVGPHPSGLAGRLELATDVFDSTTGERLLAAWIRCFEQLAAEPHLAIHSWRLLSAAEEQQLAREWNDSATALPRGATIHQDFQRQARETPQAVALVYGSERVSYAELDSWSDCIARLLAGCGVTLEDRVALATPRSCRAVAATLAILKVGAAYLPIDLDAPRERQRYEIEDGAPRLILFHELTATEADELAGSLPAIEIPARTWGKDLAFERPVPEQALAYLMYTSGSTGRPKGVAISHQAVLRLVKNTNYTHPAVGERVAQAATFSFDAATFELWVPLLAGAAVVGISRQTLLDPVALGRILAGDPTNGEPRVAIMFLTTALFHQIARQSPQVLAGLDDLLFGGQRAEVSSVRSLLERPDSERPRRLINGYGPTEATTFATWHEVRELPKTAQQVPIGRPISNSEALVLDRSGALAPQGALGELALGGPGLARGYHRRPGLTAARFVPHPAASTSGARLYRTGDLARFLSPARLETLGRTDDQVKIRGFRVEPGEVQAVLSTHPAVVANTVVALTSPDREPELVAYVVTRRPGPGVAELRAFLADRLPRYMLPGEVMLLETLPLNANGKVDRARLPVPDRGLSNPSGERPRAGTEAKLAELWKGLLGLQSIGRHDDFFTLGGHSLLAVRLNAAIEGELGAKLPLSAIFEAPTLAALARLIGERKSTTSPLVPIERRGRGRPIFLVHPGLGEVLCYRALARRLGTSRPIWGLRDVVSGADGATHPSIEELAAFYVGAMRGAQPHGPYLLGGYSVGGLIAFEMARQLREQGQEIALLTLIDSASPDWIRSVYHDAKDSFYRKIARRELAANPGSGRNLGNYVELFKARVRAISAYRPKALEVPVLFLRAARVEVSLRLRRRLPKSRPTLGWEAYFLTPPEVFTVGGWHGTMMAEPYVAGTAKKLSQVLREIAPIPRVLHPASTPPPPGQTAGSVAVAGSRRSKRSETMNMIEVTSLSKTYAGGVEALRDVSVSLAAGKILGLLGPNGAGKSTLVRILATLTQPTSGIARVAGFSVAQQAEQVRRAIGYVGQASGVDIFATGRENLLLQGHLMEVPSRELKPRVSELLSIFQLEDNADRMVRTYSGGMKRRVDLAMNLVHQPRLLFLDEPTTGLDPESRRLLWQEIRRLVAERGMTMLLTTHYLDEADTLADELAIIDHGQLIAEGTPDELKHQLRGDRVSLGLASEHDFSRAEGLLRRLDGILDLVQDAEEIHVHVARGAESVPEIVAALDKAGLKLRALSLHRPSLDDVYLAATGHVFDAGAPATPPAPTGMPG